MNPLKKFSVLILICLPLLSQSQYMSIFGTNSTSWNVSVENWLTNQWETDSIVAGTDTIINSISYRKIEFYEINHASGDPPVLIQSAFIREDNDSGRGWIAYWKNDVFYEDLFMDLSLEVDDSININGYFYRVDSVYLQGTLKHVRILYGYAIPLKYPASTGLLTFIEGIGTTFGFTYQTELIDYLPHQHSQPYLLCNYRDGNLLYYHNNPDPFFNGCYLRDTITSVNNKDKKILIYPNPVRSILTIKNISRVPVLYDIRGIRMEIHGIRSDNDVLMDVSSLPAGIYFLNTESIFEKIQILR